MNEAMSAARMYHSALSLSIRAIYANHEHNTSVSIICVITIQHVKQCRELYTQDKEKRKELHDPYRSTIEAGKVIALQFRMHCMVFVCMRGSLSLSSRLSNGQLQVSMCEEYSYYAPDVR